MMTGMTGFGAFLSSNHPPERQWDLARRIDALGFDSIWTGDHVSFHLPRYDSMALLASYASITRRVKLGCAVYLLALRPPAVAAQATATLDVLSGGRLIFGVGVGGENPKEFELCGVPHRERGGGPPPPSARAPPRVARPLDRGGGPGRTGPRRY